MRRLSVFVLLAFIIVLIASAAVSAPREGKDHLWWAERLLSELDDMNNGYVHQRRAKGIAWKGYGSGESYAYTDCSGFLNGLIQHVYGIDRDGLHRWLGVDARKSGPTANRYYAAIAEQRGFVRITRVSDIRPGDIMAILYPEDKRNTGHVMLVAGLPEKVNADRPFVQDAEQWKVPVIDSSASPHGPFDTRWREGGRQQSGVGRGSVRLYGNAGNELVGYSWSFSPKSRFIPVAERPVVIGRFAGRLSEP